jgi:hypothetical protein
MSLDSTGSTKYSTFKEFQQAQALMTRLRHAVVPYSASRRVPEATEEFGITLTVQEYYQTPELN